MLESFRSARGLIWAALLGAVAGGALVALLGREVLWSLIAFSLAALLIWRFIPFQPAVISAAASTAPADPLAALPPLTRLLLERLPLPVMLLDSGQRVLLVNRDMRAALGPALERKHLSAVLRNPGVLDAVDVTRRSGEPGSASFTIAGPVERHYEAYTARIDEGLVALLLHDITAIRRSEQMRADFVANASHELRTPLAAVTGFIETLRGPARDDEAARERFLAIMAQEAARMRRLIDDLLSLTRIELNEHVPPQGRVALEPIVRQATAALAPLAAQDDITVSVAAGPLPEILGDHDELVQLFQNLIHNAIKYGRPGGDVAVTLGRDNGHVFAAVKDDGEGIPREALPRLTERFYRVDVKRSRERGGTGLGLAIVKHILSRHQGRLSIDSRVGEGSTFTVFLPALAEPEAPENPLESVESRPVTEVL
jgi:two-component system, OmpR family, phosphate regulon sensor histidine kinase PhoR